MRRSVYVVLLSTSAFIPAAFFSAAFAQTEDPFELNAIVLQSGETNTIEVTDEDLGRTDPTDLQDLFKNEPAISVGSSIPASQKLYVYGVEETNLSVTIDGGRQNNKIFHHNATTLIDPDLLKAVRIDPGVAPADAGPGALAGSVAYETKDVGDLLQAGRSFGGSIAGEYDSNGDVFTTTNTAYGRVDGFEVLGTFKYATGGLRTDGDGADITGSGTNLLSGLGKLAYETDMGHRFELSYEQVIDDEARPYRANIGAIIGGRPVPLTRNYELDRRNIVLSYTTPDAAGWWDPTVRLAFSETGLAITEDVDQEIFGTTNSLNGTIQNRFALARGSVTVGTDFYHDTAELDYRYFPDASFNEFGTESVTNVGVFAQARLEPVDRLRLSLGARADYQEFEGTDGSRFEDAGFSGNASIEYDVLDSTTVSIGYSNVWGGFALAENFIINPAWTYPAGGIEPVTSENLFAAIRTDLGNWTLDARVFQTQIDNARAPNYSGGPELTTDMQSRGYELGAQFNWASGFARVGYADITTEVDGRVADSFTGNYLTVPMGQNFSLEVAHTFVAYGLTVGAEAQIVLEETNTYNFAGGLGEPLPAYEVFNAYVEYRPEAIRGLTLRGEVNNLFDEAYASRATYGQEFIDVTALQEPGRSFAISASLQF